MTCIVGLEHEDRVWLAADSAGVDGHLGAVNSTQPKIFRVGGAVVGGCGSFRVLQVVKRLSFEHHGDAWDSIERFVDAYRKALREAGCLRRSSDVESPANYSSLLVGIAGVLFSVQSDFAYLHREEGFDAVGCAADLALGSMHASAALNDRLNAAAGFRESGLPPLERLRAALECAVQFNAGVRPPFSFFPPEDAGG